MIIINIIIMIIMTINMVIMIMIIIKKNRLQGPIGADRLQISKTPWRFFQDPLEPKFSKTPWKDFQKVLENSPRPLGNLSKTLWITT